MNTNSVRISLHTLGCRLNQAEIAALENSFSAHGYAVVEQACPSDIAVINTCTVTANGDADTRRLVSHIGRLNPDVRIALVGCQAQVQKQKLAGLPNVRWVVGNQNKMDLPNILEQDLNPSQVQVLTETIERKPFVMPAPAIDRRHTRANIKIQDGCDFFCSFCEIPYARGRARSRVFSDILLEARALTQAGHKELVLTGINIGTYGYEDKVLMDVIMVLEHIPGVQRLRISSIEPTTIPLAILDRMEQGKVCRHLHVPLQSGDDHVLVDMKRLYTVAQFRQFLEVAQSRIPDICLGTDVIVGFPSETESHFESTLEFLRESPLHYFHVFSYSPRLMAKSRLQKTCAPAVITRRSKALRELSSRKRRLFWSSLLGTTTAVLFEQYKDGRWMGLTSHYAKVAVRSDLNLANTLAPARLTKALDHLMEGVLL